MNSLLLKDEEGNVYKGEAFTLAYEDDAKFTAEFTIPENYESGYEILQRSDSKSW